MEVYNATSSSLTPFFPLYKNYEHPLTTVVAKGPTPYYQSPFLVPNSFVQQAYQNLVTRYSENVTEISKPLILKEINETLVRVKDNPQEIAMFKKMLDVRFAKDVNCWYGFFGITPNNYGCDLRELIFNIDGSETEEGTKLLATLRDIASSHTIQKKLHIVTDIDDTLYANNEHKTYISGSDVSWPQKKPYPGVKEFYKQLHSLPNSTGYSTVLSATPGLLKMSKLKSPKLQSILGHDYGFVQGNERKRNMLGQVPGILDTWWKSGNNPGSSFYAGIADIKFGRFVQYARIFPERELIWIGDNGQGDVVAGVKMLNEYPNVKVFIHEVAPITEPDERIQYFKSYSELGEKFMDLGLFTQADVDKIINSANHECSLTPQATEAHKNVHCRRHTGGSRGVKSKSKSKSKTKSKSKSKSKSKTKTKSKTKKYI